VIDCPRRERKGMNINNVFFIISLSYYDEK